MTDIRIEKDLNHKFKNGIYRNTLRVKADRPDLRDRKFKNEFKIDPTKWAAKIDYRPIMPAVLDQLTLGACVWHSLANHIKFVHKLDYLPSRLFGYYNSRVMDGTVQSDSGTEVRTGIKVSSSIGVCPETEWPYNIEKFKIKPPKICYEDSKKELVHNYYRLNDIDDIKQNMNDGFLTSCGLSLYESFESKAVAQTGYAPFPGRNTTEQMIGGHCILLCGYGKAKDFLSDESIKFWKISPELDVILIQNSWNTDWALDGYFVVSEEWFKDPNFYSDCWVVRPN